LISIGVIATLLLGLAATGLGIDALRKIDKIEKMNFTVPATSIITPDGGATISGVVGLDATSIGPKVTAVEFLATGGSYHDAKIGTGGRSAVGWVSEWKTTTVRNGTYEITSVGYDAAGQSSRSTSVTVKVVNF
jgi:YD repeat-containing protein